MGPAGGATGGDRGTLILCARDTAGLGPPFVTFLDGGEGLLRGAFGGVLGGLGAIPGGFGATLGFP